VTDTPPAHGNRDTILAGILLAALLLVLLVASGLRIPFPDFNEAKGIWQAVIGGLAGLVLLGAGAFVIYFGARKHTIAGILAGVIVILVALPLVNVAVGLPAVIKPFFDLLQLLVDLLNSIFNFLGGLTG
jgi:hypothetical protein